MIATLTFALAGAAFPAGVLVVLAAAGLLALEDALLDWLALLELEPQAARRSETASAVAAALALIAPVVNDRGTSSP